MIRLSILVAAVGSLILLWHECGQDLSVFCYRIGLGAFTGMRSLAPVRVAPSQSRHLSAARNGSECLRPSVISSTRFLIPTDSES